MIRSTKHRSILILVMACLLLASGLAVYLVIGRGADAQAEARQACISAIPVLPGQTAKNETVDQNLHDYQRAGQLAAKAAHDDTKWTALASAYGTVVDAWAQVETVFGADWKEGDPAPILVGNAASAAAGLRQEIPTITQAEDTIRTQCAIATS